ncbi:YfbU family protein [Vibrio vulnificus]|nr:YfbU family protein [Vibrio vulnificus]EID0719247.1 YfbU family protein [Vibrio vulnificus]EID0743435.1 YfbU family protein [Vibrio vulnificus]EJL7820305.1 YfbU family protein [Vibrio vulnificus]
MEFTRKERLNLINQYKILARLYPEDAEHYDELREILEDGYEIFYSMVDQWISDDMPKEEGKFVLDILDLYRFIEDYKRISKDENIINHRRSSFMGFDGNNESEYMAFARFLIIKQGKFSEQKDYLRQNDNLNSHMPMVHIYKRMLEKWKALGKPYQLTADQIQQILDL